jgi:predicted nucleotidyltransferase
MKKKSLNISKRIDPEKAEVIIAVKSIADRYSMSIFIIGATARDLVIECAFGVKTIRATADIDFGIMVQDWEQFEELTKHLIESGKIRKTVKQYRFLFGDHQLIDILPFGPIVDNEKIIRLPGSGEMNMIGYDEAFQHAIEVQIQEDPPVFIKMASPVCLAIMKLVSWHERYPDRDKDAKDFHFIMSHYLEFDNYEDGIEFHRDLMDSSDFDYELTGARILGRAIYAIALPMTRKKIEEILLRETDPYSAYKFLRDMEGIIPNEENFKKNMEYLEQVRTGFLDMRS